MTFHIMNDKMILVRFRLRWKELPARLTLFVLLAFNVYFYFQLFPVLVLRAAFGF